MTKVVKFIKSFPPCEQTFKEFTTIRVVTGESKSESASGVQSLPHRAGLIRDHVRPIFDDKPAAGKKH